MIYGVSLSIWSTEKERPARGINRTNLVNFCELLSHRAMVQQQSSSHNTSEYFLSAHTSCSSDRLTKGVHPHCGQSWVKEGWVLNHTCHILLILQVGGEAEHADHGGGAVGVGSFILFNSEDVLWRI